MALWARHGALLSLLLGLGAFLVDRGQKFYQIDIAGWRGGEVVPVTSFFNYILIWNRGISYGFLSGLPQYMILALVAAAMILLVVWWLKADTFLVKAGLALALGGAASNALDRYLWGGVADFFHFFINGWSFYVFNLADVSISIGAGLLIVDLLVPKKDGTV
ncbi:Lipoprotein signal peptidase [hydrothermal vent metagenome]|uniref:Lipoprotein signal peptidase n=1 Tax=hydrothermal vent metagenome TaxID=652676 RepID=A0A3B0U8E5_9ZZZZ